MTIIPFINLDLTEKLMVVRRRDEICWELTNVRDKSEKMKLTDENR